MNRLNAMFVFVLAGLLFAGRIMAGQGVYTVEQAADGKKSYDRHCAECHHMNLKGSGHGPELAGPNFLAQWGARSAADFISFNREFMPPQAAGSLSESVVVDIVAHILRINGRFLL